MKYGGKSCMKTYQPTSKSDFFIGGYPITLRIQKGSPALFPPNASFFPLRAKAIPCIIASPKSKQQHAPHLISSMLQPHPWARGCGGNIHIQNLMSATTVRWYSIYMRLCQSECHQTRHHKWILSYSRNQLACLSMVALRIEKWILDYSLWKTLARNREDTSWPIRCDWVALHLVGLFASIWK